MSDELKNYKIINVLDELSSELEILLDNELYLSALIVALTIPDFMGKIENPNRKTKDRYIKWFDDNFVSYMGYTPSNCPFIKIGLGKSNLNGKLCYALRCKLLHEGHNDLKKNLNIDEFVLVREKEGFVNGNNSGVDEDFVQLEDGQLAVALTNYQYISIREIVNGLLKGAENYRKNHDVERQLTHLKINDGGGKVPNILSSVLYRKTKKK